MLKKAWLIYKDYAKTLIINQSFQFLTLNFAFYHKLQSQILLDEIMLKNQSLQKFGISGTSNILISIFLVANPLVWYSAISAILQNAITNMSLDPLTGAIVWGAHFSGIIISALLGASLTKKIENNRFLTFWMIFGALSSLTLLFIYNTNALGLSLIALLLGASLGIGMPACMGYFTKFIPIEKRGRISGITILVFIIGMLVFNFLPYNALILGVALAVWRGSSLAIFLCRPRLASEHIEQKKVTPKYSWILKQRPFMLYFVPWVMFSLINYIASPAQSNLGGSIIAQLLLIQNGLVGVFAIIGGFLLDRIGRRMVAVFGFVMLGISYSIIGILPGSSIGWYFGAISGGVAWGFFFVIFFLTIWGDLSDRYQSDKFYALGVLPFFISRFLAIALADGITATVKSDVALFSFIAFFLFIAVFPLFLAPETLPEKAMKDRDLKSYLDKAQKCVQKENEKNQRKEIKKEQAESKQTRKETDDSKEFDEAKKLAEKYY